MNFNNENPPVENKMSNNLTLQNFNNNSFYLYNGMNMNNPNPKIRQKKKNSMNNMNLQHDEMNNNSKMGNYDNNSINNNEFISNQGFNSKINKELGNYMDLSNEELAKHAILISKDQCGCRFIQKKISENSDFSNNHLFPHVKT